MLIRRMDAASPLNNSIDDIGDSDHSRLSSPGPSTVVAKRESQSKAEQYDDGEDKESVGDVDSEGSDDKDNGDVDVDVDDPKSRYSYKDYSRILPGEEGSIPSLSMGPLPTPSESPSGTTGGGSIRVQKLPAKLNAMLSNPASQHIISWMPHGRSWKVHKPKDFVTDVIPCYFEYTNYNSFVRLVNAWGFRRITSGVDRNSYYHELFLRGMPHLHGRMRRLTATEKKPHVDRRDEPDFYAISRQHPLPEVPLLSVSTAGASPQVPSEIMTSSVQQPTGTAAFGLSKRASVVANLLAARQRLQARSGEDSGLGAQASLSRQLPLLGAIDSLQQSAQPVQGTAPSLSSGLGLLGGNSPIAPEMAPSLLMENAILRRQLLAEAAVANRNGSVLGSSAGNIRQYLGSNSSSLSSNGLHTSQVGLPELPSMGANPANPAGTDDLSKFSRLLRRQQQQEQERKRILQELLLARQERGSQSSASLAGAQDDALRSLGESNPPLFSQYGSQSNSAALLGLRGAEQSGNLVGGSTSNAALMGLGAGEGVLAGALRASGAGSPHRSFALPQHGTVGGLTASRGSDASSLAAELLRFQQRER